MSGIGGILRRDRALVDRSTLRSLVHTLSQHAPDGHDIWVSGTVGFGHAHLRTTQESLAELQPACMASYPLRGEHAVGTHLIRS